MPLDLFVWLVSWFLAGVTRKVWSGGNMYTFTCTVAKYKGKKG